MKKVKLSDFIDYLEKQVGQPYLWGGQHTKLTPYTYVDIIERKETSSQNAEDAIAYCKNLFDNGASVLYAYDCSSLGMYYLQNVTKTYSHDMSANGMMGECEKADEPKKGYWVFRLNDGKATHIGYMVNDTEVIHAKGRKYGVVKEQYKKSYWHTCGIPKCIDFDPEPTPEPSAPTERLVKVVGGSVRVRDGNGAGNVQIGTAHNGKWYKEHGKNKPSDTFPLIRQCEEYPYWYCIEYNGQIGYITSKPCYTEVIEK